MPRILHALVPLLFLACRAAAQEPRAFTFVPPEGDRLELPWRLVLLPDGKVESQFYWSGIRHSSVVQAKVESGRIELAATPRWNVVLVRQPDGSLLLHDEAEKKDRVFRPSKEWDEKFEKASPVPRTKAEAIVTLRKVLEPKVLAKIRGTKREDLILLHHGFGTWVRNALGLWEAESPLRDDLGGGHPDDASMRLVEAFWEDLQREGAADSPR